MTKLEIRAKTARLESINDQLLTEICYIDQLMRSVGFANGLQTFKATAEEIIRTNAQITS